MFHNIEQNTDEWLELRAGKPTSSSLGKIMANYGKPFGEPAKKYAVNIAVEQMTGKPIASLGFSNEHTERGHEQEPIARTLYESATFSKVSSGGFFDLGNFGCSPDGLVGDEGIIEIKSHIPTAHYANIRRGGIDPTYKWQIYGNLKFTGRDWIDYISFCNDFPEEKKLYTCRVYKEDIQEQSEQIDDRLGQFYDLIASIHEEINTSNYSI